MNLFIGKILSENEALKQEMTNIQKEMAAMEDVKVDNKIQSSQNYEVAQLQKEIKNWRKEHEARQKEATEGQDKWLKKVQGRSLVYP